MQFAKHTCREHRLGCYRVGCSDSVRQIFMGCCAAVPACCLQSTHLQVAMCVDPNYDGDLNIATASIERDRRVYKIYRA